MHSLPKIPEVKEEDLIEIKLLHPSAPLLFGQACNLLFNAFFGENFLIAPISLSLDEKEI